MGPRTDLCEFLFGEKKATKRSNLHDATRKGVRTTVNRIYRDISISHHSSVLQIERKNGKNIYGGPCTYYIVIYIGAMPARVTDIKM